MLKQQLQNLQLIPYTLLLAMHCRLQHYRKCSVSERVHLTAVPLR